MMLSAFILVAFCRARSFLGREQVLKERITGLAAEVKALLARPLVFEPSLFPRALPGAIPPVDVLADLAPKFDSKVVPPPPNLNNNFIVLFLCAYLALSVSLFARNFLGNITFPELRVQEHLTIITSIVLGLGMRRFCSSICNMVAGAFRQFIGRLSSWTVLERLYNPAGPSDPSTGVVPEEDFSKSHGKGPDKSSPSSHRPSIFFTNLSMFGARRNGAPQNPEPGHLTKHHAVEGVNRNLKESGPTNTRAPRGASDGESLRARAADFMVMGFAYGYRSPTAVYAMQRR